MVAAAVVVIVALGGRLGQQERDEHGLHDGHPGPSRTTPARTSRERPLKPPRRRRARRKRAWWCSTAPKPPDLAHNVSDSLRQSGYAQATALNGRPPGANQVTVVEYAPGHRADAEGVARSLAVTQVQPMESATAALAGSATVVVVVGLDKASSAAGGGESSGTAATSVP